MKRLILVVAIGSLTTVVSLAALQTRNTGGHRLHLQIATPGQRPSLILPPGNSIELSALTMERDEASVMHLKGVVEVRTFWPGASPRPLMVLHADEATYNLNTGEIDARGNMRVTFEKLR